MEETEALRNVALLEEVGLWRLGLETTAWSCCLLPVFLRYEQSQLYTLTAKWPPASMLLLPRWTVSSQTKSQNKCSPLELFLLRDFATETYTKMYDTVCMVRVPGVECVGQGTKKKGGKRREEQLKGDETKTVWN